jgi:hypothetical protein
MEMVQINYFGRTMYTLRLKPGSRIGQVAGSVELEKVPRARLKVLDGAAKISPCKGGHFE